MQVPMDEAGRLSRQMRFIVEIDRLKQVLRQTVVMDASRRENSAEHSWHLAMMATVLVEYANEPVDLARVVRLVLAHDLVEIDAGDTFVYDDKLNESKAEREQQAAERIFNLLPPEQAAELRALWDEYEERSTPESRFAYALDRLQPLLHNFVTRGVMWRKHGVTAERVLAKNSGMADGSTELWDYARQMVRDAVAQGYLQP